MTLNGRVQLLQAREHNFREIKPSTKLPSCVEALEEQLKREPRPFPKLKWARDDIEDIEGFQYDDFVVEGYKPHPPIAMKMSV